MLRRLTRWLSSLFQAPDRRAMLLRLMAEDAAALAIALNPQAPWATLLASVVSQVGAIPDAPTRNAAAIQRAAALALEKMGKRP